MSESVYTLLKYWEWFRKEYPNGSIERFMDYLCDQNTKGGGL